MHNLPIGYLVTVLLFCLAIGYVLIPRKWADVFHPVGLFLNIINEVPFLAFLWLAASTWLAFSEGDVYSPLGWVSFALSIAAAVGLGFLLFRGLKAAPAVRQAMDVSFGEGWQSAIDGGLKEQLNKNFTETALFGPLFIRRHDVKRVANISYGDAGKRNLLDVYRHRSQPDGCPVLVHLHGGAFVSGRKNRHSLPMIYRLASRGWVCVSANYRLSPEARFPDHLIDLKKVIAWVRENGLEFGADPQKIIVSGSSAGGHLAALAALTQNDPKFQPGFERADTSVAAAVPLYGYYGAIHSWEEVPSSPLAYKGKNVPPFFVAHGERDTLVPVEDARRFVEHLRRVSTNPVVYAELPDAEHNFDLFHSVRGNAVINGIEAFANRVIYHNVYKRKI